MEPFKILGKCPLKLYLLYCEGFLQPCMWSSWCSSCVNRDGLHSGVSSKVCCDSYWWSPKLRTVMIFSFVKFPSKPLSSIPPLAVLPFFPHIPTFSLPPSLTYCTALLSFLSCPCSFFSFSFTLSFLLLLFLLGWEEVTGLFLDPWGIERWSSLSCNPFFNRP